MKTLTGQFPSTIKSWAYGHDLDMIPFSENGDSFAPGLTADSRKLQPLAFVATADLRKIYRTYKKADMIDLTLDPDNYQIIVTTHGEIEATARIPYCSPTDELLASFFRHVETRKEETAPAADGPEEIALPLDLRSDGDGRYRFSASALQPLTGCRYNATYQDVIRFDFHDGSCYVPAKMVYELYSLVSRKAVITLGLVSAVEFTSGQVNRRTGELERVTADVIRLTIEDGIKVTRNLIPLRDHQPHPAARVYVVSLPRPLSAETTPDEPETADPAPADVITPTAPETTPDEPETADPAPAAVIPPTAPETTPATVKRPKRRQTGQKRPARRSSPVRAPRLPDIAHDPLNDPDSWYPPLDVEPVKKSAAITAVDNAAWVHPFED